MKKPRYVPLRDDHHTCKGPRARLMFRVNLAKYKARLEKPRKKV